MSGSLASFRDLRGIGAATEARLHEAGIYTWEALAAAAAALAAVRGEGDTLRDVAVRVARQGEEAGGRTVSRLPGAERHEAFVLRLALGEDGEPLRSALTHVRTMTEQVWPGWVPGEVARFVADQAGVRAAAPSAPPAQARPPAPRREPSEHVVLLDLGREIGRDARDVDLVLTGTGTGGDGFRYRAELQSRRLGAADGEGWTVLATSAGRAAAPGDLALHFAGVRTAPGIQRRRLRLTVTPAVPVAEPPAFALADSSVQVS